MQKQKEPMVRQAQHDRHDSNPKHPTPDPTYLLYRQLLNLGNMKLLLTSFFIFLLSCTTTKKLTTNEAPSGAVSGTDFYKTSFAFNWQKRDSFAVAEILEGNIPAFLKKLVPVQTEITNADGSKIKATFYVTPDYISIGSNNDWARIPLTPMAAQKIADSLHCFLPTRKIVDDIYKAAKVKIEPVPMYAFRDSTPTMLHHHLIIEGQRKNRNGLIAGIKKDVVISGKITRDARANRVAIYGWHKMDSKPIQPLYVGHVNWYVDYSHGIRLVHRQIKVDGRWMDYIDVLKHPVYKKLICDEEYCDFYKYSY